MQVRQAIAIGIAVGAVGVVGDDRFAGAQVVVADDAVIEGIEVVLQLPAIGQGVA